MNNRAVLLLILAVVTVVGTFNTVRYWQGLYGGFFRARALGNHIEFVYQRRMATNAMTSFTFWSMWLAIGSRYGLGQVSSHVVRALLYVPLVVGFASLATNLIVMVSIYISGKPMMFVPPSFRDAAAKRWKEGPELR